MEMKSCHDVYDGKYLHQIQPTPSYKHPAAAAFFPMKISENCKED